MSTFAEVPAEPVTLTDVSRRTGHYLHAALKRPVLIRDRYGDVVLEIRRFEPPQTDEVNV